MFTFYTYLICGVFTKITCDVLYLNRLMHSDIIFGKQWDKVLSPNFVPGSLCAPEPRKLILTFKTFKKSSKS